MSRTVGYSAVRRALVAVSPYMPSVYVTDEQSITLKEYKYNGVNLSPLYKHVLKPIAVFGVSLTPEWVAPNVITLLGLVLTVSATLMGLYLSPDFLQETPMWWKLYSGVCIFLYQTLDNMDGQQARKIGASSPLGQLFDHGCDAVNASIIILLVAINTRCGAEWAFIGCVQAYLTFYFTTWEEYVCGHFTLGYLNGPDDGLLTTALVIIGAAVVGDSVWDSQVLGFEVRYAPMMILIVCGCTTVLLQTFVLFTKYQQQMMNSLAALGSFIMLMLQCTVIMNNTPTAPVWTIFACGSAFALLVCKLILAHVCKVKFALVQSSHLVLVPAVAFPQYTWLSAVGAVFILAHYAIVTVDDICVHLQIRPFSVSEKEEEGQKESEIN